MTTRNSKIKTKILNRFFISPFALFLILLLISTTSLLVMLIMLASQAATENKPPRILFLTWDENNLNQIYLTDPVGSTPLQLTQTAHGVLDFTVAPGSNQVVYSALREDGSSDLYLLQTDIPEESLLLISCTKALCNNPVWNPAGNLLVYEKRDVDGPNSPPGPPRLWWLDPSTGDTIAVFENEEWYALGAGFSPDGKWLSYNAPDLQEVHAYSLDTGQTITIQSQTGEKATWHPKENIMLTSEIQPEGEAFSTHIFLVEIPAAVVTDISQERTVNDGTASFSPDGSQILFGRKVARAPMGRQIWLADADGNNPYRLTNDFDYNHGRPSWSPSGNLILTQRFNIDTPNAEPGIWIVNVQDGSLTEIVTPGIHPVWLP